MFVEKKATLDFELKNLPSQLFEFLITTYDWRFFDKINPI